MADTKQETEITHWGETDKEFFDAMMLSDDINHFFAIWIKFPFIYIIKTFTYIKYQPFCFSPLLVSLRLVQERMIKNSYKIVYIQIWDFPMKVQTGGRELTFRASWSLHEKTLARRRHLMFFGISLWGTCFSINFCHHLWKNTYFLPK